ncbi:Transferrin [Pseudolycoriella hygida]|uniref:Transferrin n=1 Tax=Pseudolycoriella hygida TaxID=35572 RepID=A0A9Q0S154_9DIPT|nr:Transferrin [Pseudolycoriella hygida]
MNSPFRNLLISLCCLISYGCATTTYKMCVPHHIIDACKQIASKTDSNVKFECILGRDKMECLEKVQNRQADFLAADPEDMYVAFKRKNEDFSIFSELRTREEPSAEFRYEGIILTRKNNDINSTADFKAKKSCHTGFGRNVGYKIPISRLSKSGVLKISSDPTLSAVEKELRALSELFTSSCIVGTYSPDEEINRNLKQKYSNLCALCEDPVKCNYPDKFSGYEGAIRCLVENGGDIAFTKVIYVRRFFGLPIGNNPAKTEAQANADDYEYLCEDGSRRPVTGTPCSWAKRPWQGFMSNADSNSNVAELQSGLRYWYNNGLDGVEKSVASKLWIDDKHTVVDNNILALPGCHLDRALYKDVIERGGSSSQKIRLCVETDIEMKKCEILKQAAYSRDVRPEFICVENKDCLKTVQESKADAVVVEPTDFHRAHDLQLKKIMREVIDPENVYVVVADKNVDLDISKKCTFKFDTSDPRARSVAVAFGRAVNINAIQSTTTSQIEIVHSSRLTEDKYSDKQLICPGLTLKPLNEAKTCNFDGRFTRGIFVRDSLVGTELEGIVHGFKSLSDSFGHGADLENVFELFGEFEAGAKDVLFTDDAKLLESDDDVNVLTKS